MRDEDYLTQEIIMHQSREKAQQTINGARKATDKLMEFINQQEIKKIRSSI